MLVFLILSFGYLTGWGAMFASPTFRWNFKLWRFFVRVSASHCTNNSNVLGIVAHDIGFSRIDLIDFDLGYFVPS